MKRENWTAAGVLIDSIDATRTIPIGSVDRFAATFYWGRLDFYAARGGGCLEQEGEELCPDDSRHVPHLPTPAEIQSHYRDASSVLVAIDSTRLIYGNVEPSLHRVLSREAEELCGGKCGSLLLYHWKLSPARGTGDD